MENAQRLRQSAGSTPRSTSRNSKRHQSLQTTASSAGDDDLFDSPETVEAFALLEAALDEANFSKSAIDLLRQKEMMLEPPTTAARFISIESAIGEPAANNDAHPSLKLATSKHGSRHSRHSSWSSASSGANVLRKKSLRSAKQRSPPRSYSTTPSTTSCSTEIDLATGPERSVEYTGQGRLLSRNFAIDSATSIHVAARTTSKPLKPIPEISHRQSDIFRSHDAAETFADQTYRSAREKYF